MTGEPIVVPDVSESPDYLEAIPGVVSEICVPVKVGESTIGALNIESLVPLPAGMLEQLEQLRGAAGRSPARHRRHAGGVGMGPDGQRLDGHLRDHRRAAHARAAGALRDGTPRRWTRPHSFSTRSGGHTVAAAAGPLAEDLFDLRAGRPRRAVLAGRRDPILLHRLRRPRPGLRRAPAPSATAGPGRWWCSPCGPTGPGWAAWCWPTPGRSS